MNDYCDIHNRYKIIQQTELWNEVFCPECKAEWELILQREHFVELHNDGVCSALGEECDWVKPAFVIQGDNNNE